MLVVQHGTVLVQCNDVAVGQFFFRVGNRTAIVEMYIKLRLTGTKCLFGSAMPASAAPGSSTQAIKFVGSLAGPREMQVIQCCGRIYTFNVVRLTRIGDLANQYAFCTLGRQVLADVVELMYDANVKLLRPKPFWCSRRCMPIVLFLVVNEDRCLARRIHQVAVRRSGER